MYVGRVGNNGPTALGATLIWDELVGGASLLWGELTRNHSYGTSLLPVQRRRTQYWDGYSYNLTHLWPLSNVQCARHIVGFLTTVWYTLYKLLFNLLIYLQEGRRENNTVKGVGGRGWRKMKSRGFVPSRKFSAVLRYSSRSVSYTHLTLPTKRIV